MGTGVRIATASVRTDLAMTGFPWSVVHGRRATARVAPTEGYKECLAGGRTGASAPTVLRNEEERRGGALPLPRAGKSAKRRRWRMQRAGFEEAPRLADATVAGNRLARRWAREPRPYGSATRGAMGGRPQGSPLRKRYKECDFYRAGRCRHRPLRGEFGENKRKKQEDTEVSSCF